MPANSLTSPHNRSFLLKDVATQIGAELIGDDTLAVTRLVHPSAYTHSTDLVLAMDDKLLPLLAGQKIAAAVISTKAPLDPVVASTVLRVARPRLALSYLTNLFALPAEYGAGIHPQAVIDPTAHIGQRVTIGAFCVVGARAYIGDDCVLQSQVTVEADAIIGEATTLRAGVRIGARCVLGARNLVHFNSSIGSDGFSFVTPERGSVEAAKSDGTITATNHQGLLRIASLGPVIIGDDVEIGSNTSIDRGTIIATRIGRGTKIDNQVQIGHNVQIGEDCTICGRVGIAGSAIIGNRVVLGGASGVADHARIGDDAMVMALSGISGTVPSKTIYGGFAAVPRERFMEQVFGINRLKSLSKKVESLTESVKTLEETAKKS